MSTRNYSLSLLVIVTSLGLVMCGGESPMSPSIEETTTAKDSLGATGLTSSAKGGQPKVTICHIPPGNPANAHEITVGAPAVPAHLAHGDNVGSCEPEPPDACDVAVCSAFDQEDECLQDPALGCVWSGSAEVGTCGCPL